MSGWDVLSSATPEALQGIKSRKVLLSGTAIEAELQRDTRHGAPAAPEGFVAQPPRDAVGGLIGQFSKSTQKVWVSVDERVFDLPRARFAFAIDGYLSWGLGSRRKGVTVLFGGAESRTETSVSILVFADGKLNFLGEKSLPEVSATYFRDAVSSMVAELHLQYPTARFVQAAPLSNWNFEEGDCRVEYVGDLPLRRLSFRPLVRGYSRKSAFLIPAVVGVLGVAVYAGLLMAGWSKYSQAVADYDLAIADPAIQSKGGVDTDFLTVMNARRVYMEQPRRQTALAGKTSDIVRGIGVVPNVRILEMKLPAPSLSPQQQVGISPNPNADAQRQLLTPGRAPDVWIVVAVPKVDQPAITQATAVINEIGNRTGMSLRLAHNGWREDKDRRILNIEGFIHD